MERPEAPDRDQSLSTETTISGIEVQEYFADVFAIHDELFSLNMLSTVGLTADYNTCAPLSCTVCMTRENVRERTEQTAYDWAEDHVRAWYSSSSVRWFWCHK